jgi:hypothetical protein
MRAGCSWQETDVNKGDFTGEPIVPNFPKSSGLGCAWLSSTGAAGDESAQFPVDVDPRGHQVTVYVKSFVAAWSPEQAGLDLGSDDRIFRLDRVEGTACADLKKVLPDTLEKALIHK